jgi:hypothetical protein
MGDHADAGLPRAKRTNDRKTALEKPTRLKNALLLGGTLVLLFAAAETTFRIVYHPENLESVVRFDERLGWVLKPNARSRSVDNQKGLDYSIRTNSLGLRDREVKENKKPGTKRILIIGDSVAYGTGVDAEWRFSDFLSRALGDDFEVLNSAVCGWGTDQELLYYEDRGKALDPDFVILTFTMANDVLNNSLDHLFLGSAAKPRFALVDGLLSLERETLEPPELRLHDEVRKVLRESRVLLFTKRRIDALRYEKHVRHACAEDHGGFDKHGLDNDYSHWSVYERAYGPPFENAWRVTEALLERLSRACAGDGVQLIVFAFPLKLEVDDAWRRQLLGHFGIDSTLLDLRKPYDRLATICRDRGIECLYPLGTFREAARSRALYFARDSHPNAYGHAAAAGVILGVLREEFSVDFRIAEADRAYFEPVVAARPISIGTTATDHVTNAITEH